MKNVKAMWLRNIFINEYEGRAAHLMIANHPVWWAAFTNEERSYVLNGPKGFNKSKRGGRRHGKSNR